MIGQRKLSPQEQATLSFDTQVKRVRLNRIYAATLGVYTNMMARSPQISPSDPRAEIINNVVSLADIVPEITEATETAQMPASTVPEETKVEVKPNVVEFKPELNTGHLDQDELRAYIEEIHNQGFDQEAA